MTMTVRIRFFASLRETLGAEEQLLLPDAPHTVGEVRDLLIDRGGAHAIALARGRAVRTALNQVLCDETATVASGAELAFFPPVTGG